MGSKHSSLSSKSNSHNPKGSGSSPSPSTFNPMGPTRDSQHQNPFAQMGSKSSQSSKSGSQWTYDVFISFRGIDTRKVFVSHLHAALKNAGVNTFLDDDKLGKGAELQPSLLQAIEGSKISIVVFSRSYTESRWCLNELIEIMECRRTYGQAVLPVFYHVDPSDVRNQKGAFGEALESLASSIYTGKGVQQTVLSKWRSALAEAANLTGWDVTNSRNEADLVLRIVEDVLRKLDDKLLSITEFPVGLESRVNEVIGFIKKGTGRVCKVGIWGMGGLGKTTVAKTIYNHIHRKFEDRCFIENIREVCEKGSGINLQKQLLSDILKAKVKIHDVPTGRNAIEKRLSGKRALVVLDDVSKSKQVDDLFAKCKWMDSGSVLIVTTRDRFIFKSLEVDHFFEINKMDENESLELFSWHAFRKVSPRGDFNQLSRKVVNYCGGLPLALEVLGSYLYERTEEEWEGVLSKLERIPDEQVQEKLRISYDGLNEKEQKIFLDICCFFIGKDRAYVTDILNDCAFFPKIGITVLEERSLIKIEKNNKLGMHDLLRDMGREIIRQSSPEDPENRSRLWAHEDVLDVLKEHTGTKAIEGLALKMEDTSKDYFETKAFEKMKKLRLLKLNHVQLVGDYKYIPQHLRWVYWQGFPLKHIPDNFDQRNAVAIDLKYSNINIVWKEPQLLERLKILNLSHSSKLKHTPNFSKLPNLEKLILKHCTSLSELHESIGDLSNLLVINLMGCTSLSNLPRRIYQLKSVKTLIISGCVKIDKLEEEIVQMESLTSLIAKDTGIEKMPRSIVKSKSIGYISLCGYEGLARDIFPSIIWSWMSPTMEPPPLVSIDMQKNNLGDLVPVHSNCSELRSVWVQCCSKAQLNEELRRILDNRYDTNFTELERTSHASHVSDLFLRSLLIGMGSYRIVLHTLHKSISQGLTIGLSSDFSLPGDNHPYWLNHTGEGRSVIFKVPQTTYCCMKGMALCVVYSSTLEVENVTARCLVSVLIVNHTKCIFQIYKRATTVSFNDEDWQGIVSNLEPGDEVEFIVVFGHGFTVKKTAVYLICKEELV